MIHTICPACGKKIKAPLELAMTAAACPGCSALIAVPAAGIDRAKFIPLKILQYVAVFMLAAMMKDAAFLMLPVLLGTSVWLAILRLDNIGLNRWWSVIAAIPTAGLIFAIYLACAATGSGRRLPKKHGL